MVAAVLVAASEKAGTHRPGPSHWTVKHHLANARSRVGTSTTGQLMWILALRLPEPEGLRQGEALALRWEEVDLEVGVLTVRHTLLRKSADRMDEIMRKASGT